MRRLALLGTTFATLLLALPVDSSAQSRQQRRGDERAERDRDSDDPATTRRRRDEEWNMREGRLPGQRNAGPCPFVKVLYDAGRYIEFAGGREAAAAVAWTGEIQGIEASCRYEGSQPIQVDVSLLFAFGKGPQAQGDAKAYRYWVAVTERNRTVLAKEWFEVPAQFEAGEDRVSYRERLGAITIPRGDVSVSGANFEVLVGFEVTPQMAEFNRLGKRFRVDAAGAAQQPGATPGQTSAQ